MSDTILCPNCSCEIELSAALSSQLREELQRKYDAELRKRDQEFSRKDEELQKREASLKTARDTLDQELVKRLAAEKERWSQDALAKAKDALALDFQDLQEQLKASKAKLDVAQRAELELRNNQRELEEQKRAFELQVARKLDEERVKIREQALNEAAANRDLKDAEKEKLINDLRREIDNLKRKSEQGSQQLQGEVLELELEDILSREFPFDAIEPVPKGQFGGDVLHHVCDSRGQRCGTILWESKRTKNWSDGWLPKLRDDQRAAKAQVAVLVSLEMPGSVTTLGCLEGVWVSNRACLTGLAAALRGGLIEIAAARRSVEGRQGKMELLYNYLSSSEFKQRMEGIVEAFATMKNDLEAEKRATQRLWAKREKQLERALLNTAGFHGDLGGIIGRTLPEIASLEMPLLALEDDAQPVAAEAEEIER